MKFKDHFSSQANDYAAFRPRYPDGLFAWLADLAPDRNCVWDCATGNGQAAAGLAAHFTRVIATDASEQQILNAQAHPGIEYRVAPAEKPGLPKDSCSLITVAQAAHWFQLDAFYQCCRNVLEPSGLLAVWGYNLVEIDAEVDALVLEFYEKKVGAYWPPERRLVETNYRELPFPFSELPAAEFQMQAEWRLDDLLGYVRTWSASQRYLAARGENPVESLVEALRNCWPEPSEKRPVVWPLFIKLARL